jgi:hypothetical protein
MGIALCGAILASTASVAGDLYGGPEDYRPTYDYRPGYGGGGPYAPPANWQGPVYGGGGGYYEPRRYETVEECRVFIKPRIDRYGREVFHRIRVCDEGRVAPPRYSAGPVAQWYGPPRPPRAIRDDYYYD